MMIYEVYDALKTAGVPEEKARAAAEAINSQVATKHDLAEAKLELKGDLKDLQGQFNTVRWMVGFNLALTAGVLLKLFT